MCCSHNTDGSKSDDDPLAINKVITKSATTKLKGTVNANV